MELPRHLKMAIAGLCLGSVLAQGAKWQEGVLAGKFEGWPSEGFLKGSGKTAWSLALGRTVDGSGDLWLEVRFKGGTHFRIAGLTSMDLGVDLPREISSLPAFPRDDRGRKEQDAMVVGHYYLLANRGMRTVLLLQVTDWSPGESKRVAWGLWQSRVGTTCSVTFRFVRMPSGSLQGLNDVVSGLRPSAAKGHVSSTHSIAARPGRVSSDRAGVRQPRSKWAVVVGISAYRDRRIVPLRYASRDALAFHDWLTSPRGGGLAPSRTRLLLDADATAGNIRDALFNWLGQALEEDVVIIYFAVHGSPQSPDRPENLFLLPYDANYEKVTTTAFPMWDIETAIKRFIPSRRIVVIADACHSGGVGQPFDVARRGLGGTRDNRITFGLQALSTVDEGVCVISASDKKQLSQEGQQWGGGHGVFTWFLLRGLKGDADYNKDGSVTLGELVPYLSEQVRRATKSAQCPTVAGKFDPALAIGQ